jgi:hypothetical protein
MPKLEPRKQTIRSDIDHRGRCSMTDTDTRQFKTAGPQDQTFKLYGLWLNCSISSAAAFGLAIRVHSAGLL